MTLEEAYAEHREWAVNVVKTWARQWGVTPVHQFSEDVVQDAFLDLFRGRMRDETGIGRGLVVHAVKWRWNVALNARFKKRRDVRLTRSIDAFRETDEDWDVANRWANTEASALARVEIAEGLGRLKPRGRRALLDYALTPDSAVPMRTVVSIRRRLRGKDTGKWAAKETVGAVA